jgi:hypothetical protein
VTLAEGIMAHALGAETSCLTDCSTHTAAQRDARRCCLKSLYEKIQGRYLSLCDPMAGVGDDAVMLQVDSACTWVNDKDPACIALLSKIFPQATGYDLGKEPEKAFHEADLIYLDYNTFTLNKFHTKQRVFGSTRRREMGYSYSDITNFAFAHASKFVILNDCTVHGLYIFPWDSKPCAERILGKTFNSIDEFFELLPDYYSKVYPQWELAAVAPYRHTRGRANGATTYLLFEKVQPIASTRRNHRELIVQMEKER